MDNTVTQITVADLDALRGVVDLAARRGAFRAEELTTIGATYDKLTAFLATVVAQAQATADANQDSDAPAADTPAETDTTTQGE